MLEVNSRLSTSGGKIDVVGVKQIVNVECVGGEQFSFRVHLEPRDAATKVCAHVLGFGWRGGVDVATDVEVVVVAGEFFAADDFGERGDVAELAVRRDDLLNVLGLEEVLGTTLSVLAVGIDEQHLATAVGWLGAL